MSEKQKQSTGSQLVQGGILALILLVVPAWVFFDLPLPMSNNSSKTPVVNSPSARDIVQDSYNQVYNDAVAQYERAKRSGDVLQMTHHASMCAAAANQAGRELDYNKWLKLEKEHRAKLINN